ncbi:MAG: sigma-54 dependent transcriptional regulator [Rhodobacteraceae bacterium]|nr:sigma-54 dependent transcriptional regulator [Paracoccaceae bacterium]MCY4197047.1 sigma-54 dependent transcriptional regulator [Paracoccaceae bacterium]
MTPGTILLADDDAAVRKVLSRALIGTGCKVHTTSLLTTLSRWVTEGRGDLVITDVAMPDGNGIDTLRELRKARPELPIIVISAQNTIMTAIQAQEAEAFAYLPKPFDLPQLLGQVREALQHLRRVATETVSASDEELPLVGRAPAMQTMYQALAKSLNSDLALHLHGETGTGKSLVAKVIHDCSDRRHLPMVVVSPHRLDNPQATEGLFARARGGTVVLEEVADLTDSGQQILADLLDRPVGHPRIISISQNDLSASMANGEFRRDLYFRLCGAIIEVPSLRQRLADIPRLANYFLRDNDKTDRSPAFVSGDPPPPIIAYKWPGNVRELRNAVIKASLTQPKDEVTWDDIAESLHLGQTVLRSDAEPALGAFRDRIRRELKAYIASHGTDLPAPGLYMRVLRDVETPLIMAMLEATNGNRSKCAEILGINRNTLRKKVRELDIVYRKISE